MSTLTREGVVIDREPGECEPDRRRRVGARDVETWRPYSKRYQVDFAGRTGYAQLALEAGVPIVPVAHAGAHETLLVLTSGRWLARALGMRRLVRAEVWPIHLSLPWVVGFGPLPHLPLPAEFRYLVGAPLEETSAPELDRKVREAIQAQLYTLRSEREPARGCWLNASAARAPASPPAARGSR